MVVVESAGKISLFADFLCGCSLFGTEKSLFLHLEIGIAPFPPLGGHVSLWSLVICANFWR